MKNRILFLFLFLILLIAFIITGAYYLLLLIILFLTLILVSLFTMLWNVNKIQIKALSNGNDLYLFYQSNGLPFGKLSISLDIENLFFEEVYQSSFEMILGEKEIKHKIPFNQNNLGKYRINTQTFIITDILGLFRKKINRDVFTEKMQSYQYQHSLNVINQTTQEVVVYQSSKSDDYDIREYRVGDSLKDIHYKMSYKLSNCMIKEKHKDKGQHISVYLDLSGTNEECEKVFAYLNILVENLQTYHEVCMVKWISNEVIYEQKVADMIELTQCINKVLSMSKVKDYHRIPCTWIITPSGLKGGE